MNITEFRQATKTLNKLVRQNFDGIVSIRKSMGDLYLEPSRYIPELIITIKDFDIMRAGVKTEKCTQVSELINSYLANANIDARVIIYGAYGAGKEQRCHYGCVTRWDNDYAKYIEGIKQKRKEDNILI